MSPSGCCVTTHIRCGTAIITTSTSSPCASSKPDYMNAGITAGALAAIVAVLVSLPLKSPDDSLLNSASVAIASLLVGLISGLMWKMLVNTEGRPKKFGILWGVSSVTVGAMLLSAFAVQLDNLIPFALPLVVIVCTYHRRLDSSIWPRPLAIALVDRSGSSGGGSRPGHTSC